MPIKRIVVSLLLVAVAVWVLLSLKRIPGDRWGVAGEPGSAVVLKPGLRLVPWGLKALVLYPKGPFEIVFPAPRDTAGGRYRVFSADGAEVRPRIRLKLEIPESGVGPFHAAAGGSSEAPIREVLRPELRRQAASWKAPHMMGNREGFGVALSDGLKPGLEALGASLLVLDIETVELAPGGRAALQRAHAGSKNRRVLVLGVDSADWTIINRLAGRGRLPVLARAIRSGASGPLKSIEPLLSPLIWTTIATGVGPEAHGILDFLTPDPETGAMVPATSRIRRAPALWNLAPAWGKKTGAVGWLATWPAEPIDGYIVSDRFGFLAFAGQAPGVSTAPDVLHPPDLLAGRDELSVASADVPASRVRRFLDVSEPEIDAARRPGYEKGNRINNFIHSLSTAESYARVGLELYTAEEPPLALVYFEFLDAVCHLFMAFQPPAGPGVGGPDVGRFGGAVDAAYEHQDRLLKDFVDAVTDSTVVLIISDHGFRSGDARLSGDADMEEANAARWHLPDGVIIMTGFGVRPGSKLRNASVFDVAPTVLAVLGCPIPRAMRGRVLVEAFEPGFFSAGDSLRVDEFPASGYSPPGPASAAAGGAAARTGDSGGDAFAAAGGGGAGVESEAARHVNLGIVLAGGGKLGQAELEFIRALEIDPGSRTAANNLASIYMKQSRLGEAVRVLEGILARDPGYALGWSNLGVCAQRLGRREQALTHYDRALKLEPADQRSLTNRGFLLLDLERPADAERDFRRAISISERSAQAHYGLGMALAGQVRPDEAVRELEAALALDPGHERARQSLEQLRRPR